MNPLSRLLKEHLPAFDVGVMHHGLADHGRDYVLVLQNSLGPSPGTYRLTFTHVVKLNYLTKVADTAWRQSWADVFVDYRRWQAAGEPDGYVFATNWSLAYPGLEAVDDNLETVSWSERLGHRMYAATIETDRFKIMLIFYDARLEKISNDVTVASKSIIPLQSNNLS